MVCLAKAKARRKSPPKPKTAKDRLKFDIAERLGLLEQVLRDGWGSLSAKECGQVGGVLSRTFKERKANLQGKRLLATPARVI